MSKPYVTIFERVDLLDADIKKLEAMIHANDGDIEHLEHQVKYISDLREMCTDLARSRDSANKLLTVLEKRLVQLDGRIDDHERLLEQKTSLPVDTGMFFDLSKCKANTMTIEICWTPVATKPKQDCKCVVIHTSGFMAHTFALYDKRSDTYRQYDPRLYEHSTLEITHYLILPEWPK